FGKIEKTHWMRNGHVICAVRRFRGLPIAIEINPQNGLELNRIELPIKNALLRQTAITENRQGGLLLSLPGRKPAELDASGRKLHWNCPVSNVSCALRLTVGNTLFAGNGSLVYPLFEIDKAGKTVWECYADGTTLVENAVLQQPFPLIRF